MAGQIMLNSDSSPHTLATIHPFGNLDLIYKMTLTCRLKCSVEILLIHTDPF